MPEALVVDIQLAAPPPGSREQLVDRPPPPGSRAAKLARLKELRAKYGHINSDAAAPPVTSPVRRAEPAVTFEPQSPSRPLVAGGLRWTLAPAALSLEAHHRRYRRLRQIGRGRFGEVYLCAELRTARLLVMKSVNAQCVEHLEEWHLRSKDPVFFGASMVVELPHGLLSFDIARPMMLDVGALLLQG